MINRHAEQQKQKGNNSIWARRFYQHKHVISVRAACTRNKYFAAASLGQRGNTARQTTRYVISSDDDAEHRRGDRSERHRRGFPRLKLDDFRKQMAQNGLCVLKSPRTLGAKLGKRETMISLSAEDDTLEGNNTGRGFSPQTGLSCH